MRVAHVALLVAFVSTRAASVDPPVLNMIHKDAVDDADSMEVEAFDGDLPPIEGQFVGATEYNEDNVPHSTPSPTAAPSSPVTLKQWIVSKLEYLLGIKLT